MGNEEKTVSLGKEGIYDARQLGVPKMLILGIQHTFAMFGACLLYTSCVFLSPLDREQEAPGEVYSCRRGGFLPDAD